LLNRRLFIYLLHLSGQNIYLFLRNVKWSLLNSRLSLA
jgi:hypothetical protein